MAHLSPPDSSNATGQHGVGRIIFEMQDLQGRFCHKKISAEWGKQENRAFRRKAERTLTDIGLLKINFTRNSATTQCMESALNEPDEQSVELPS